MLVQRFMRDRSEWTGVASELLEGLSNLATADQREARKFPVDSTRLSMRLRRIEPVLAMTGVAVEFWREKNARLITLTKVDPVTTERPGSNSPELILLPVTQEPIEQLHDAMIGLMAAAHEVSTAMERIIDHMEADRAADV